MAKYTWGRTVFPVCPHLHILGHPSRVHHSTGAAYFAAQGVRQIPQHLEILRASHTRPPDTRILASIISTVSETDFTMSRISTYLSSGVIGIVLYYNGLGSLNRLDLLHNAGTNGCHLRTGCWGRRW